MPYCQPSQAGLSSTTQAICRRLGRLFDALDDEITSSVVEGPKRHACDQEPAGQPANGILDDIKAFRYVLTRRLEREGWTMSYDGGDRMKVRAPGHKRPYARHGHPLDKEPTTLAQDVLAWASTPRDHGGNPYCLDFVRRAQREAGERA